MLDLGFVLLLAAWSSGVGLALLRRLAPPFSHPADAFALAIPLGLGVLSLVATGLGVLGLLTPAWIAVVLATGVVLGLWRFTFREVRLEREVVAVRTLVDRSFDVALVATVVGTLLVALTPVTDGDALCYHLQVPKVFLYHRATTFLPDLHETVYPLIVEMLYAVGLAIRGPVACRLVHWVLGLGFALNVTALARPILGDRARWAGTIALLVPAVSNGMAAPLNDVGLAAFCNAALFSLTRWWTRPNAGAAILTGLLAGLALGVKYPALVWVGIMGIVMGLRAWRSGESLRVLRQVALFGVVALLVGGWWYARAYWHTGNPVFPYFRRVFGNGLDEVLEPSWRPLAITPWNLATALVPMTLEPDRFESLSHQFGPVFLLLLPGLVLVRSPSRARLLVVFGLVFMALCLTQRQSMRFLLSAIGPLSVGVAWVAVAWWKRGPAGRMLVLVLVLALGFEATLAISRSRHGLGVVLGQESIEAYLARREPTWIVGRWIEAKLPRSANIVGQDHRGFYIPRPYTMELAHRRRTGLGAGAESAEAIVARLRGRGFTHLLMCPPAPEDAVEFDPTLSRRLSSWLSRRQPVFARQLTDADGVVRHYAIYELDDVPRTADAGRDRR